ncbi:MAG TPA: ABC transporter substrate-binding protein, partial [Paracoccaceae bacterium]|nr:ABC transporter substrate-binding protein [Paracoccaceae bacterium]
MTRLLVLLVLLSLGATPAAAYDVKESPLLAPAVASGELPPAAERLPAEPLVVDLAARAREPGVQGGTLRMFITRARDVRYMVVYGYARLVGYDENYELKPDIARAVDNVDDRIFTFHLRKGHRWSDGQPFTSEDFRYFWEDVANDPDLSPGGVPEFLLVDGEPPTVTILDETTIRYEWRAPNPRFLTELAAARDPFIYRPAHYLKKFHAKYTPADSLAPAMAKHKVRNWAALHNTMDNMYNNDNPELPTLQPWTVKSDRNQQGYDLYRNPFYHRVDQAGIQLPYIDKVELTIAAAGLIAQKVTLGEVDLQVRSLT